MRDLVLKMSISVDGFVSDLEGTNTWMFGADPEAKAWSVETLWSAGLHIMGSRTFRSMASYWPTATDPFAAPMNRIPKTVFSRQGPAILENATATASHDEARIPAETGVVTEQPSCAGSWAQAHVASGDLADDIATLKARKGKPIIAHGGVRFARSLVARGLVDEFILLVVPVVLGKGLSVFSDLAAPARLSLMSAKAFPGGAVTKVYRAA